MPSPIQILPQRLKGQEVVRLVLSRTTDEEAKENEEEMPKLNREIKSPRARLNEDRLAVIPHPPSPSSATPDSSTPTSSLTLPLVKRWQWRWLHPVRTRRLFHLPQFVAHTLSSLMSMLRVATFLLVHSSTGRKASDEFPVGDEGATQQRRTESPPSCMRKASSKKTSKDEKDEEDEKDWDKKEPLVLLQRKEVRFDSVVVHTPFILSPSSLSDLSAEDEKEETFDQMENPFVQPTLVVPGVSVVSSSLLFNRMIGISSQLLIDVRSREEYNDAHLPRSLSMPLMDEDIEQETSLKELEKRVHKGDMRAARMRARHNIVLVGERNDVEKLSYLANLLVEEGKCASLAVLSPSYTAFANIYPFLSNCKVTPDDEPFGHKHISLFPSYPSEIITSFMYLGSQVDATNVSNLAKLNISHIVNMTTEIQVQENSNFCYHSFPLNDDPDEVVDSVMYEVVQLLATCERRKERVLIHCAQGVSRSPLIVLAYLVHEYRWTLQSAFEYVKQRRPRVMPNYGFFLALGRLEIECANKFGTLYETMDIYGEQLKPLSLNHAFVGTLSLCIDVAEAQKQYIELMAYKSRLDHENVDECGDVDDLSKTFSNEDSAKSDNSLQLECDEDSSVVSMDSMIVHETEEMEIANAKRW